MYIVEEVGDTENVVTMRTDKNESGFNNGPNISERMKYFAGNSNSRKILRYNKLLQSYIMTLVNKVIRMMLRLKV